MTRDNKSTARPRLRFPEFRRSGPWELRKLSDLLVERKERNRQLRYGAEEVLSVSGEYGCVNQIELLGRSYAGVSVKDYHVVETGNLVYTKSPLKKNPFGIIKENKGKPGVVSTLYAVYHATDDGHPAYLDHYFSRDYHLNSYLQPIVRKGAKNDMKVNNSAVLGGDLFAPTLEEQKRIADCLTSLDHVIAAQRQKVEALKAHKRGLLQKLFPREGETIPRVRFPEFRNGPGWEEATLGEIAEIKLGKMLDSEKHKTGRLLPYLNNISLRWNEVDTSKLPQMYFEDDELDRFGLKAGDVVVCEGGEPGRAAVWDGRLPDLKFQKAIHRVRFTIPFVANLLVLYLEAIAGTRRFEMLFTGGGIKHLTRETFAQLKVPLIPLAEQQRITDCLSSLGAQIAIESRKRAALDVHKKGLMQQLFPSPESD